MTASAAGVGRGGLLAGAAGRLLAFCLECRQIITPNDVVPAELFSFQMTAINMPPQRLPAHAERPSRLRDQDHVFHASKRTDLLTTVKAYHSCIPYGSVVQCNHGKHFHGVSHGQ